MQMNIEKVAALLVKLRKENGLTQNDLSTKLGISFQAVSKWERGENLPEAGMLYEIAKIYNITVDEILNGELLSKSDVEVGVVRKNILLVIGFALSVISIIPFLFLYQSDLQLALIVLFVPFVIGIVLNIVSHIVPHIKN